MRVKCHLSGADISIDDAFIISKRNTQHLIKFHRQQIQSLEKLLAEFSIVEHVQFHRNDGKNKTSVRHRWVSAVAAEALSLAHAPHHVFVSWPKFQTEVREARWRHLKSDHLFGSAAKKIPLADFESVMKFGSSLLDELAARTQLKTQSQHGFLSIVAPVWRIRNTHSSRALMRAGGPALLAELLACGLPNEQAVHIVSCAQRPSGANAPAAASSTAQTK